MYLHKLEQLNEEGNKIQKLNINNFIFLNIDSNK